MSQQLRQMMGKAKETLKNANGQGLVEYALILVLIAIVVLAAVKGVGHTTSNVFDAVNTAIKP